jgi:hypothetical protein
MDNTVFDDRREPTSLMLLTSEKKLYKTFARKKGWSTGKFLRVAARAVILYSEKRVKTIEEAMDMSAYLDKDYREN